MLGLDTPSQTQNMELLHWLRCGAGCDVTPPLFDRGPHNDRAVAVFVEEAESGSATAGPIMADFLSQAQVPPATS